MRRRSSKYLFYSGMVLGFLLLFLASTQTLVCADQPRTPAVHTMRLPAGGVQPQALVDERGVVHIIYLAGDAQRSDILYIRSTDDGEHFSAPVRVNSQAGSAIAMGTVRGAHLAVGRGGRIFVAWMGSSTAQPRGPGGATPMLFTRSRATDGVSDMSFEPQRNVMQSKPGLDGGGSVAADRQGNVYVAWHAPAAPGAGEQSRRVWLVRSTDDGQTFSAEQPGSTADTGACGCCGMRLFSAPDGHLYALYRTANQTVHRDMSLLEWPAPFREKAAHSTCVGPMNASVCIMSTAAFAAAGTEVLAAWETKGQIDWGRITDGGNVKPQAAPGSGKNRKHPALAVNRAGEILLAWTEETGWNKGGSVAWQVYDKQGAPIGTTSHARNLPAWGSPAAFARGDGSFVVVY